MRERLDRVGTPKEAEIRVSLGDAEALLRSKQQGLENDRLAD